MPYLRLHLRELCAVMTSCAPSAPVGGQPLSGSPLYVIIDHPRETTTPLHPTGHYLVPTVLHTHLLRAGSRTPGLHLRPPSSLSLAPLEYLHSPRTFSTLEEATFQELVARVNGVKCRGCTRRMTHLCAEPPLHRDLHRLLRSPRCTTRLGRRGLGERGALGGRTANLLRKGDGLERAEQVESHGGGGYVSRAREAKGVHRVLRREVQQRADRAEDRRQVHAPAAASVQRGSGAFLEEPLGEPARALRPFVVYRAPDVG